MASRGYERPERHNEYFIPGDGISREVIQADICRYLGNDALVKPGTHQGHQGYLIRAYRNLTTEMIADLKADSARWAQEVKRRDNMGYTRGTYAHDLRRSGSPNTPPVSYASSSIHELRQKNEPSPSTYSATPSQFVDPYAQQPQYSAPQAQPFAQPAYTSSQSPGFGQNAYSSPPQQNPYSAQNQPPISAPDGHPSSYTYSGNPVYSYDGRNAAPRYAGPGYDNEPDYSNVSSGMAYPPTTAPSDARLVMDTRYTPDAGFPEHRQGPNRPQQNRDPHRRPR
ncbi:hypothetical protein BGW36DRAFT_289651 [Talaromyces proteolyticus]|uniref:Transcription factor RfeG n=1 Tax=Talaromyces proteolyticus TaxID=1131652 RepID=A0AAD4KWT2_9EURO|nr:uncharacterized protein BGW36DRAFT_289651 [Talaromyces proteolyticus]KAH8701755.1 hypothetical protein BGW36DRAFT_289651 [Talaromyces proteolyticus]